jgi:hypothetical protein
MQAPMAERQLALPPETWEAIMLQKLSEEIAECYRHASHCRERATDALDPSTKRDFLDMEWRWLSLARSYDCGTAIEFHCTFSNKNSTTNRGYF